MKLKKVLGAIVLAFILLVTLSVTVFANGTGKEEPLRYTYIAVLNYGIDQGTVSTSVTSNITGSSSVKRVKIKMELQKLSNGSYSTVQTWEETFDSRNASMDESKLTSPLSTYRLKVTFTAYTASDSETVVKYAN